MELTSEQGRAIVYGDDNDWDEVSGTRQIIENTRWSIVHEAIFLHKPSGKHYSLVWSRGATEQQDESPFEYDEPEPVEVELKEVTRMEWVAVEHVG